MRSVTRSLRSFVEEKKMEKSLEIIARSKKDKTLGDSAAKIMDSLEKCVKSLGEFHVKIRSTVINVYEFISWLEPRPEQGEWLWIHGYHLHIWSEYCQIRANQHNNQLINFVYASIMAFGSEDNGNNYKAVESGVNNLLENMEKNVAKMYVVPFNQDKHWELLVFVPEEDKIYWFDPLQSIDGAKRKMLKMFLEKTAKRYHTQVKNKDDPGNGYKWDFVTLNHKKQSGFWECGYYVMLYMEKLASAKGTDIVQYFPVDDGPFSREELLSVTTVT